MSIRRKGDKGNDATHIKQSADVEPDYLLEDDVASHLSDTGNAARFVRDHQDRVRFCPAIGHLINDGHRWKPDTCGEVLRLAKVTVAQMYQEAGQARGKEQRQAITSWALVSESESRLRAMVSVAQPDLAVEAHELDADPWLLNVGNGTLDLRTATLRPHNSRDLITKIARADYDPCAHSALWDRVLLRALPDESVRRYFQKVAGYTSTGCTGEDIFVLVFGPTRTAKGTVQEANASALGDYALTAELDLLAERDRPGGPRPELVRLRGARMVSIYETSRRLKLSASLIKTIAGSDPITARDLYAKPITFKPNAKIWIATNHRPQVPADDDALWERIREVPFNVTIPEVERDPGVRAALRDDPAHLAAILSWIVDGAILWQAEGLIQPAAVRAAGKDYRTEMDTIARFVIECCVLGPNAWTSAGRLWGEYETWTQECGERPVSAAEFRDGLRRLNCEPERRKVGGRGWRGIGLTGERQISAVAAQPVWGVR